MSLPQYAPRYLHNNNFTVLIPQPWPQSVNPEIVIIDDKDEEKSEEDKEISISNKFQIRIPDHNEESESDSESLEHRYEDDLFLNDKKKKGRPKKVIDIDQNKLKSIYEKWIFKHLNSMYLNEKLRADSLRIRLARVAKKIPLVCLNKTQPISKYKSATVRYFLEAYWIAFTKFLELCDKKVSSKVNSKIPAEPPIINFPLEFFEFIAICYPKAKIKVLINSKNCPGIEAKPRGKNIKSIVDENFKYRECTTKAMIAKFIKLNKMYKQCIWLLNQFGHNLLESDPTNRSVGIMQDMLDLMNL